MAKDINETLAAGNGGGSRHLVYNENVHVRYPNKDKELYTAVLPARVEGGEPAEYLPYRQEENEAYFTKWAIGVYYYPFVNKELSMVSLESFESDAFDPIGELGKMAKRDPRYAILAGYEEDGKTRIKNAFKHPDYRIPGRTQVFAMNGLVLFDRDAEEDKPYIIQVPGTAFAGKGAGGGKQNQSWGLLAELNRRNRKASESSDVSEKYYWGDITDPRNLQPCVCKLSPPPGGGVPIYNMTPAENEDPIQTTKAVLAARHDLDKILYPIEEGEIIDRLVKFYADIPELLKRAFSHRIMNFEKKLRSATSVSSTAPAREEEEDEVPMENFRPSRKPSIESAEPVGKDSAAEVDVQSKRSFAPEAEDDDIPAPSTGRSSSRPATRRVVDDALPAGKVEDSAPAAEEDGEDKEPEVYASGPERKPRAKESGAKHAQKLRGLLDEE